MEYLLSVDAGGSKTIGLLTTLDLELIKIISSGPMNILENGENELRKNLRCLRKIREEIPEGAKIHSCFGMPALGEFENSEEFLMSIINEETGLQPKLLVNDVVIAWASGTLGQDGVHVVAGTGTIAYGRHGIRECRSGGWGSLIGDEGSAYDIGRETLRRVCRQIDGRELETALKDFIMKSLGFKHWWELSNWVYSRPFSDRRPAIASIAQLTYEAAQIGDEVAVEILKNAGREIALCAIAVIRRLELSSPLTSYSGGVLVNNYIVQQEFKDTLRRLVPNVQIQEATLHPVVGGIILLLQKLTNSKWIDVDKLQRIKQISEACERKEVQGWC